MAQHITSISIGGTHDGGHVATRSVRSVVTAGGAANANAFTNPATMRDTQRAASTLHAARSGMSITVASATVRDAAAQLQFTT